MKSFLGPRPVSEEEAYKQGFECGCSPTGEANENPYTHRLSKKRKAWLRGWMDGGAMYLPGEVSAIPTVGHADAPGSLG